MGRKKIKSSINDFCMGRRVLPPFNHLSAPPPSPGVALDYFFFHVIFSKARAVRVAT